MEEGLKGFLEAVEAGYIGTGEEGSKAEKDLRLVPVLSLAYLGDTIFDLYMRTLAVRVKNLNATDAHRYATKYVKAAAQARMADHIETLLSDEELAVFKRGRNAKSASLAKNATVGDYRKATGFEALLGWLYLSGDTERILELCRECSMYYTPKESEGSESSNRSEYSGKSD